MFDPILLWNEIALEANRVSHSNGAGEQLGPPLSARALAIVHVAMYNAYTQAKSLPPATATDQFINEAVAGAAYRTLTVLYPTQKPAFDRFLTASGDATMAGAAHGLGVLAANVVLGNRAADPGVGSATHQQSNLPRHHRPDPDNSGQGFHAPDYGKNAKGFGVTKRFRLAPPPYGNAEYDTALDQVRQKGIKPELTGNLPAGSSPRTPEETLIGLYWGYDGALNLGTPPRLYNQIVRKIAEQRNVGDVGANARLFALVNVAMADAGILAWEQKYVHDFWRPVVGVREADPSMGPGTPPAAAAPFNNHCDPHWLPLGAPLSNQIGKNFTPNFPAYPSGHATFGAAALHMTRLFYGEGGTFAAQSIGPDTLFNGMDFVSEEFNGNTKDNTGTVRPRHHRRFSNGLWQMIEENGLSRIYLGVHWIFDAFVLNAGAPDLYRSVVDANGETLYFGGVPLGLQIAEDIFTAANGGGPMMSNVNPVAAPNANALENGRTPTNASSYVR